MQNDGIEKQILEEITKKMVVKKEELVDFLDGKVEDPRAVLTAVIRSLTEKGLITSVSPVGESCYAVTQKGMRETLR
jgi:predicted transcriptional regulator